METILNLNADSERLVPRPLAETSPSLLENVKEPTAVEALKQFFEDYSWDKSLNRSRNASR